MGVIRSTDERRSKFEIPVQVQYDETQAKDKRRSKFEIPVHYSTAYAKELEYAEQAQERTAAETISIQGDIEEAQVPPMETQKKKFTIPIWQKWLLTLEEAAQYTGLGNQKLRDISNDDGCNFVLWNGSKRMLKRTRLEEYLNKAYSI